MNRYCQIYFEKSVENYALYEYLAKEGRFLDWQIIAIFYSALCYAKAYLYNKGIAQNTINSHDHIKHWLTTESGAKRVGVFHYYEKLYFDSRDARYSTKRLSPERIKQALLNYQKVKQLLVIN